MDEVEVKLDTSAQQPLALEDETPNWQIMLPASVKGGSFNGVGVDDEQRIEEQ
ncbi:uncharacterized protein PHALS_04018 [Plasmopara halstedii]|uniref:Uncharacterized protein n=1 Tax=Plasmopara halstedii TaxID=4781 RepID=A0A0P1A7V8_PLAHL|nr:uncharacterized protein PHALS_04018 [Plasmopara halstedii]CEG36769.1 hypothetical protein PHALS_04018 [Plasmopara halstedii]|eukprot:XP_024573138.1 hypothetical protein PHALS_04018 [Plasmopara halstedii]